MKKENKLSQSKVNNSISKPLVTSKNKKEISVKIDKLTKEKNEPVKVSESSKLEKKADLTLYLEFMEYYNKNDLVNTREVLKKILVVEPENSKIKEMLEVISMDETENEDSEHIFSEKMKINKDGEYEYESSEEDENIN